jgi:hypothetical protein
MNYLKKDSSARHADVIDLENHSNALGSESDGGGGHESGLDDVLFGHVLDLVLLDVKSGVNLSGIVSVSQLSDEDNGVHTGILSKSVGDEF